MFKIPLCIDVIAADEQAEMLEDMGIETSGDIWNDPTFTVCFYKIDAIMPDLRSRNKNHLPAWCVVIWFISANTTWQPLWIGLRLCLNLKA